MRHRIAVLLTTFPFLSFIARAESPRYPLIPRPMQLVTAQGDFRVTASTRIYANAPADGSGIAARLLADVLSALGKPHSVTPCSISSLPKKGILFILDTTAATGDEGYRLDISSSRIVARARTAAGLYYAFQSLRQLMPAVVGSTASINIPCCRITDMPRFSWRGLHLDVVRHFFPVDSVKKYLDLMALVKLNTFHWHLTDDQGWRIEIKKYPKLTGAGAWRKESMTGPYDDHRFDGIPYGGYYTQEQIRDVVAYAAARHITVVPEIEMPGHALAALAAYPELACTPGPFAVATEWGVFDDVFCPTETTFRFLEDVLSEVAALFPGIYIHIGGDECPKTRWKSSAFCQELMRREGLADEHELQSYFIRRIGNFLSEKGKRLIGWDEILEGGLAPDATVMSWRGEAGGIAAARLGHAVVMTPGSHCYFDHYQGDPASEPLAIGGYTPLKKVYDYEPVPADSLTPEQQRLILGAQANLWSEYLTSFRQVEYMAWPRACALAEVLWSPREGRDWNDFTGRLLHYFHLLEARNVQYARNIFDVTASVSADTQQHQMRVSLMPFIDGGVIRYTLDGSEPTESSTLYDGPVPLRQSCTVSARLFRDTLQGNVLRRDMTLHKAAARSYALARPWSQYDGGTTYGLTDGTLGRINQYTTWVGFAGEDLDATVDLGAADTVRHIRMNFYNKHRAWIWLPSEVTFTLSSDGVTYQTALTTAPSDTSANSIATVEAQWPPTPARYIRVVAKNAGKIPEGEAGAGNAAWLFADEIVVE